MHLEKRQGRNGTSFRVRITAQGFPLISKTFSTKTEALHWGKRMEADLIAGRLGTPQAHHHTVADAINRFLEEQPPGFGRWLYEAKTAAMLKWWREHFGGLKLAEIKPTTIVQGRDLLRRNPSPPKRKGGIRRPRSAATVNRYVSALSSVFQACLELWGWMEGNPCRGLRRLPEHNQRTRFLEPDEQERLLKECEADRNLLDVVCMALWTGARRGEICGMRWRFVDLKNGLATFPDTKNGETRAIPLCREAEDLLHRRFRERTLGKQDFVFPAEKSDGPIDVSHRFRRFCKKAGVEQFRFHDLRHSAASALARAGVSERKMQEVLGHKTVAMTKRYSHLRPSDLRDAVAVLGQATRNAG